MEPIRGRVAQILDSKQVVLNVGSARDVDVDMIFKVINPRGEQIKDPETDLVLGSVESPKLLIRVIEVQANLSVATISAANPAVTPGALGPFARVLMPPRWVDQFETLGTDTTKVNIGDPVVQVIQVGGKDP